MHGGSLLESNKVVACGAVYLHEGLAVYHIRIAQTLKQFALNGPFGFAQELALVAPEG